MIFKVKEDFILGKTFLFVSLTLLIESVSCDVGESLFLTPYVDIGDFKTAKTVSEVNSSYFLGVKSYSGFITVDKEFNSNTWFWYFPVQDEIENAPLVIWLQGGPGASSLYGLFNGIGPFRYENETLIKNVDSWHIRHSILFIDNPIGSGFSFADKTDGYCRNQTQITANLYEFLQQFYKIFPELQPVPMFLSGESYAGKYIPHLAYEIHNRNSNEELKINLQGMAIGSAWIDPPNMYEISSLAYQIGLIDIQQETEMKILENEVRLAIEEEDWRVAYLKRANVIIYLIETANLTSPYNYIDANAYVNDPPYGRFITSDLIRDAVHVGNASYIWMSDFVFALLMDDVMISAKPILEMLLKHYPIMMFNGQLDLMVANNNLEKLYNSLNWTGAEDFKMAKRNPWNYVEKVVGYEKRAGNLYQVMFRNAGHCVGLEKPDLLRMKITEFTRSNSQFKTSNETKNVVVDERENLIDSDALESGRTKRNIIAKNNSWQNM